MLLDVSRMHTARMQGTVMLDIWEVNPIISCSQHALTQSLVYSKLYMDKGLKSYICILSGRFRPPFLFTFLSCVVSSWIIVSTGDSRVIGRQ